MMYNLFHNVIKQNYRDKVKLLYSDTDSFILGFTEVEDIYHEMKSGALAPYIDSSNYEPDSPYFNNTNKGSFGFMKDEIGGKVVTEAICLLPKSYSLLVEDHDGGDEHVMACKGVSHKEQKKIRHKTYRELLEGKIKQVFVKSSTIRSNNFQLYTTHTRKAGMSNIDIKRYYITNKTSVAYSHPMCNNNKRDRYADESQPPAAKKIGVE